jgi:hypothetical protein
MSSAQTPITAADAAQAPRWHAAYQQLIDEIRAVPDADLVTINIDIPAAVATVYGALPGIVALRPQMTSLPRFDLARIDKIEPYAGALAHAHTLYQAASTPPQPIEQLSSAGTALRQILLSDASALATRGFVNADRLKLVRGSTGYLDLAFDLTTLVSLMREHWSVISSKTAVQVAELDRAELLAEQITAAVGRRDQASLDIADTSKNRQRAFTLFVNAYDEARRAITFLRWADGDADHIAPSLYAGRVSRRRPVAQPHDATPVAPAVPAPAPVSPAPVSAAARNTSPIS